MISPDDFVQQGIGAEQFIEQEAGIGIRVPVEVQVETPVRREQADHQRQAFVQKLKIGVEIIPIVVIAFGELPAFGLARVLAATDAR